MSSLDDLKHTVYRLRAPGGCPWDREQTHQSLCEHLIEETAELLDTIDRMDMPHMREELGDVLLQVVLHAQIAADNGHFTLDDVAAEINDKLIRRHPHVFGTVDAKTSDEVLVNWEKIKSQEQAAKGKPATVKEPPSRLPALLLACEVYKQVQKNPEYYGTHPLNEPVKAIATELTEETAGAMLFKLTAACRVAKIDPESALRRHAAKEMAALKAAVGVSS
ncbi:MAG: MazG family protein [Verrucomicrobiota bacterium]|nr:MazG family protein [Verrucomicrobiota bacterium]